MSALAERYRALPRAGKWLVWFLAFLAFYFGVIDLALVRAHKWSVEADNLEAMIAERAKKSSLIDGSQGDLERAMLAYGKPAAPQKRRDAAGDLDKRVRQVLRAHGIEPKRTVAKGPDPLQRAKGAEGPKLERYAIEIAFECDTQRLLGVMRDLERAAEVSSLSRVTIRRIVDSGKSGKDAVAMLQVSMTPELWNIAPTSTNTASRSEARQ